MKRQLLLLATLVLVACQQEFIVIVDNQSAGDIYFVGQTRSPVRQVVRAKSVGRVNVSPGCQIVEIGGLARFIDLAKVPRETWESNDSGSVIELHAIIDGTRIYLQARNGKPHELSLEVSCHDT